MSFERPSLQQTMNSTLQADALKLGSSRGTRRGASSSCSSGKDRVNSNDRVLFPLKQQTMNFQLHQVEGVADQCGSNRSINMEDVIEANAVRRNNVNLQKQFATQKMGEKWDTGADPGVKYKKREPFFIPNMSRERNVNNTIANKTVTNFSMFSHRNSHQVHNTKTISAFSPQDFDISQSVSQVKQLTAIDQNFSKSSRIRPMLIQRQNRKDPSYTLIKPLGKKKMTEPISRVPMALRRPGSALGNKFNRNKFVSNSPVKVVQLGMTQENNLRKQRIKPALPFRHETPNIRLKALEHEGCKVFANLKAEAVDEIGGDHFGNDTLKKVEFQQMNFQDCEESAILPGGTAGNSTQNNIFQTEQSTMEQNLSLSFEDRSVLIQAQGEHIALTNKLNLTQPLQLNKRRTSRITMERAFATLRVEQYRKAALLGHLNPANQLNRTTIGGTSLTLDDKPSEKENDVVLERFKRNHLKPMHNSYKLYKAPFSKTRSFSVWNGKEVVRGTELPGLFTKASYQDSLYCSQVSEKPEIHELSILEGESHQASHTSIKLADNTTRFNFRLPGSKGENTTNHGLIDALERNITPSVFSENQNSMDFTARGSALPLQQPSQMDSHHQKRKQYDLVINQKESRSPKRDTTNTTLRAGHGHMSVVDNQPVTLSSRITITTTSPIQKSPANSSGREDPLEGEIRGSKIGVSIDRKNSQTNKDLNVIFNPTENNMTMMGVGAKNIIVISKNSAVTGQTLNKSGIQGKKYVAVPGSATGQERSSKNATTINLNPMDSQNSNYKNTKSNLINHTIEKSPFKGKNVNNASSLLGSGSQIENVNSQGPIEMTQVQGFSTGETVVSANPIPESLPPINQRLASLPLNKLASDHQTIITDDELMSSGIMIEKPREDQNLTQVQVQQILNPPDVSVLLPIIEPSEASKPGTAKEVIKSDVASSCNEEMIAYIDDDGAQQKTVSEIQHEESKQLGVICPVREHHLEVDSTRPVYTDRSYKQGKSLDKTIYRKNFDRSSQRRRDTSDRDVGSALGPIETSREKQSIMTPRQKNTGSVVSRSPVQAPKTQIHSPQGNFHNFGTIDDSLQITKVNFAAPEGQKGIIGAGIVQGGGTSSKARPAKKARLDTDQSQNHGKNPPANLTIPGVASFPSQAPDKNIVLFERFGQTTTNFDLTVNSGVTLDGTGNSKHANGGILDMAHPPTRMTVKTDTQQSEMPTPKQGKESSNEKRKGGSPTGRLMNQTLNFHESKSLIEKRHERNDSILKSLVPQSPRNVEVQLKTMSKEPSVESVVSPRSVRDGSKDDFQPSSPDTGRFNESKTLKSPRAERTGFKAGRPFNAKSNHFANRRKTASDRTDEPLIYSGDGIMSPSSFDADQLQVDASAVKFQPKQDKTQPMSPQLPKMMKASGNQTSNQEKVHYHETRMNDGIVHKYSVGSQKSTDSHYSRIEHNFMPSVPSQLGVEGNTQFIVLSPKGNNVIEIKQHEYVVASAAELNLKPPINKPIQLNQQSNRATPIIQEEGEGSPGFNYNQATLEPEHQPSAERTNNRSTFHSVLSGEKNKGAKNPTYVEFQRPSSGPDPGEVAFQIQRLTVLTPPVNEYKEAAKNITHKGQIIVKSQNTDNQARSKNTSPSRLNSGDDLIGIIDVPGSLNMGTQHSMMETPSLNYVQQDIQTPTLNHDTNASEL